MKKQQIKEYIWQELDDCQAEILCGGLKRLQEEFGSELAAFSKKPKEIVVVGSRIR